MFTRNVEEFIGKKRQARIDRIHFYGMLSFVVIAIIAWGLKPWIHF